MFDQFEIVEHVVEQRSALIVARGIVVTVSPVATFGWWAPPELGEGDWAIAMPMSIM